MDSYNLFCDLLSAQNEEKVKETLFKYGLWQDKSHWRPYGDFQNNEGTIGNQQDSAIAALIEKPINSLDAILIKECKLNGIDPKGEDAPTTMQKAVEKFFQVKNGDIFEETKTRRAELAKNVRIIAEGDSLEPNVIIADLGEGQVPEEFPNTFCSLHTGGGKNKIKFVQGTYNMGGSGVLPYCGKYQFQLILSKKHPKLSDGNDLWGFTIFRLHPSESEDEQVFHEYLVNSDSVAKDKNVYSFSKDELNILPHQESLSYGTYIKLYNYKLPPGIRSYFHLHFWRELNRFIYSPPLPILIQEQRTTPGNDIVLLGNRTRIRDNKIVEKENSKIEDYGEISGADLGIFGKRTVEITAFKEGTHRKHDEFTAKDRAVFFTINGQSHYALKRTFFDKAKLGFLKNELMIHVDCTSIPLQRRSKVFMPSRERARKSDELKTIEKDLLELVSNVDWVKRLNHLREEQEAIHNTIDEKFANKVISRLAKSNLAIAELLNIGSDFKSGVGKTKRRQSKRTASIITKNLGFFDGNRFPTKFDIYKWNAEAKGIFRKEIPQNSYVNIKFQTDVENNYLNEIRGDERGDFLCNMPEILKNIVLHNGVLKAKIQVPTEKQIGDVFIVRFELTHPYRDSFFQEIEFCVVKPRETTDTDGRTNETPKKAIPRTIPVYAQEQKGIDKGEYKTRDEMGDLWGEDLVSQVKESDQSTLVYINMDSGCLANFLKKQKNISDKKRDSIRRNYKMAILLYSLVLKAKTKRMVEDELIDDEEIIFKHMMEGIGAIILDLIIDNQKLFIEEEME